MSEIIDYAQQIIGRMWPHNSDMRLCLLHIEEALKDYKHENNMLRDKLAASEARCARLEETFQRMPHMEDIHTAMLANGGEEFIQEYCRCDESVGMVPCQYCAVHDVLRRIVAAIAAAKEGAK